MEKLKIKNIVITSRTFLKEITTPDKRFKSGLRNTGKFSTHVLFAIDIIAEQIPGIRLNEVIKLPELGAFICINIDNIISHEIKLRSVSEFNSPIIRIPTSTEYFYGHVAYAEGGYNS